LLRLKKRIVMAVCAVGEGAQGQSFNTKEI
jgi:hypothetical protein